MGRKIPQKIFDKLRGLYLSLQDYDESRVVRALGVPRHRGRIVAADPFPTRKCARRQVKPESGKLAFAAGCSVYAYAICPSLTRSRCLLTCALVQDRHG
jgi:hypothetical protein